MNEPRGVSCEAHNMSLHGTSVDLCLSNCPDGWPDLRNCGRLLCGWDLAIVDEVWRWEAL
jgi:hypothetical protein